MDDSTLNVATEFSTTPGPRKRSEGKHSGQQFREEVLEPAFLTAMTLGNMLYVDLDGTAGYGTGFLEEAFGGLIREAEGFIEPVHIRCHLFLVSKEEPSLVREIKLYISDAFDALRIADEFVS